MDIRRSKVKKKKLIFLSITLILITTIFVLFELSNGKMNSTIIARAINSFKDPVEVTYLDKIYINVNTGKAKLSPAYTYREAQHLFEQNWQPPEDSYYHSGGNVYLFYCPTSSPCDLDDEELLFVNDDAAYAEQVKGDRYHWLEFEVEVNDCVGEGTVCPYDFKDDKDYYDSLQVFVNGIKIDNAVVGGFNPYWHLVRVYVPWEPYTGALVKSLTVSSPTDYVTKGTTSNFTANISYYGESASHYTWSIIGATSDNTTVSNGLLSVAADEDDGYIRVRVTSTFDESIYAEKEIRVIDEPLSITSVTMQEESQTVVYGGTYTFHATANGTAENGLTWTVTGANKPGTTINQDGTLTVAASETATSVEVCATSTFDNTKKACLTVTLRNTILVTKIEINYDSEAAVFSSKTTYGDAADVLRRVASSPDEAGYVRDGGVWIDYCETGERCTTNLHDDGSEAMKTDRYTYIIFDVYAKPEEFDSLNPLYDFDEEHIEIWVNGVKRDDAFADDYDDRNRKIDVYIPVTVTDGKLAQYMSFYNDIDYITYGDEPEKNGMRSYDRIGDGAITYSSSDETIATVDENGYVTAIKVGTCTITATASETEDYKEYSASYTLEVLPKNIWPTISGFDQYPQYTGSPIRPEITVTINDGEVTLVKDVDYTIQYGENTEVGAGYIQIYPVKGSNYTFAAPRGVNVYVQRRTIADEDVTISTPVVAYTGDWLYPEVTIKVLGQTLLKDVDYTISYSSNLNVGTAYISIYGSGNYTGYVGKTFEIVEFTPGDMNKNGKIDLADIILLLKKYLNGDATDEEVTIGDMDSDGNIGLKDIIILLKTYLSGE